MGAALSLLSKRTNDRPRRRYCSVNGGSTTRSKASLVVREDKRRMLANCNAINGRSTPSTSLIRASRELIFPSRNVSQALRFFARCLTEVRGCYERQVSGNPCHQIRTPAHPILFIRFSDVQKTGR
jgi:hypothetical protein